MADNLDFEFEEEPGLKALLIAEENSKRLDLIEEQMKQLKAAYRLMHQQTGGYQTVIQLHNDIFTHLMSAIQEIDPLVAQKYHLSRTTAHELTQKTKPSDFKGF